MRLKYIVTTNGMPVLFSEGEKHSDVAHGVGAQSAGFAIVSYDCERAKFTAKTYGESISLGIESREEDNKLIETMLNHY